MFCDDSVHPFLTLVHPKLKSENKTIIDILIVNPESFLLVVFLRIGV